MTLKIESSHVKKLSGLLKREMKKVTEQDVPDGANPVTQLTLSILEWNATRKQAEAAFDAIMSEVVDINELRVSAPRDVVAMIGKDYPLAEERVIRLKECLQDVFLREHAVAMESLKSKNKKDIKHYLDTLGSCPPYAAAQVLLLSFGGHAFPVDEKLALLLIEEGAAPEGASVEEITAYLERQIKAADGPLAHTALKAWADTKRRKVDSLVAPPAPPPPPVVEKPATKKKTTTKKTTKKKTTTSSKGRVVGRKK